MVLARVPDIVLIGHDPESGRLQVMCLRSFHPNRTYTQILVKVCTLVIQYMLTQEMK